MSYAGDRRGQKKSPPLIKFQRAALGSVCRARETKMRTSHLIHKSYSQPTAQRSTRATQNVILGGSHLRNSHFDGCSEDSRDSSILLNSLISIVICRLVICRQYVVPALKEALRLYDPSIAASKDRMVSRGRSIRGRVGLDRSGSAIQALETLFSLLPQV